MCQDGLLMPVAAGRCISEEWLDYPIIGGIKPKEWDGFHDFVLWDELFRSGPISSIFIGLTVGAPPLRLYATKDVQAKIVLEILTGKFRICSAVTEPAAESDVRNITTTAERTADGKHYIVNKEKKWITDSIFSHCFMTAVRTGGPGAEGIAFFLVPRHSKGINCRKIEIGGGRLGATTYIAFEDVRVDASYLVGQEGAGFRLIINNFNRERIWIAFMGPRGARLCLADAWGWLQKREVANIPLVQQPVVRHKLGLMGKTVEVLQAWAEELVLTAGIGTTIDNLREKEGDRLLDGVTALLKVEAGMVGKFVTDECVKLFGGLGLTKTRQGARVEATSRGVIGLIVPGGSEDVMIDLGA